MTITITHREDNPRAGYAMRVEFHDPRYPTLTGSAATLDELHRWLDTLLKEPTKRKAQPRRAAASA